MLRTFFWYVIGWVYLTLTTPAFIRIKYLEIRSKNREKDKYANMATRKLCRFLFYMTGSKIKVTGLENMPKDQAVLFVSNHQSHMDSAIIHGFIEVDKGFISIVEVLKIPILRTWMKHMKCVFLDRSDLRQTFTCIDKSVQFLKQGHSMVIYPEGKLNQSNDVNEFKKGSLKLAVKAGVPIVPITLINSFMVMNKDGSRIKPARVELIVSKPIPTAGMGREEEKGLHDVVREIIAGKR